MISMTHLLPQMGMQIIISTDFKFLPPQMEMPTVVWMKQLKVCEMVFFWMFGNDYDNTEIMMIVMIMM